MRHDIPGVCLVLSMLDREETTRRLHAAYRGEELPVANPVLTRGPVPEAPDAQNPHQC